MLFNLYLNAVKQRVGGEVTKFTETTGLFRVGKLKTNSGKLYKDLLKLNNLTSELNVEKCTMRKMRKNFWCVTMQFYLILLLRTKILGFEWISRKFLEMLARYGAMVKKKKKGNIKNHQEKNTEQKRKQHYALKSNDWGRYVIEDYEIVKDRERPARKELFALFLYKNKKASIGTRRW